MKLNVKVLPCLIMFSGGVAGDRVAGFDDFGAKDSFSTDSGKADAPHGRLSALHHGFYCMAPNGLNLIHKALPGRWSGSTSDLETVQHFW